MKTVLLIFGGCSTEYEVSLMSASNVLDAIDRDLYEVLRLGITKQGKAYFYEGPDEKIRKDRWQETLCFEATVAMSRGEPCLWVDRGGGLERIPFDVAFPMMHGRNGEDGTVQGLLELAHIPIVGCGMESSVICMDKALAYTLVEGDGIKVPMRVKLDSVSELKSRLNDIVKLGREVFVKPVRSGSSVGVSHVNTADARAIMQAVELAFRYDSQVLIEERIEGREITCAVIGDRETATGRVAEITTPAAGFYDYKEKYTPTGTTITCPANLAEEEEQEIRTLAARIYKLLGCKGFARVDMFWTAAREVVFGEVNTIPGYTSHSLFPLMMKETGVDSTDVITQLIRMAG